MSLFFFFLMGRLSPKSTPLYSSAASDVYKRQPLNPGGSVRFFRAEMENNDGDSGSVEEG